MKPIKLRYGSSVRQNVNSKDETASVATFYVGVAGESPVIVKSAPFIDGVADISLEPIDTEIPLGDYKYQVDVEYTDGAVVKLPEPVGCCFEDDPDFLPDFIVRESLSDTEVS